MIHLICQLSVSLVCVSPLGAHFISPGAESWVVTVSSLVAVWSLDIERALWRHHEHR